MTILTHPARAQQHGARHACGRGAYYGGGSHHYSPDFSFSYAHHYSPYFGGGGYRGHHYSPNCGDGTCKVAGNLENEVPELGWEDCWIQLANNSPQLKVAVTRQSELRIESSRKNLSR